MAEMRAINRWLEALAERQRMAAVGKRMLHRGLGAGFNTWADYVEERHAQQQQLAKAAARIAHAPLAKAYEAWLEGIQELTRMRAVRGRATQTVRPSQRPRRSVHRSGHCNVRARCRC